jgi:hypothetical protein
MTRPALTAWTIALAALLGYCLYSALTEPPPAYPPGSPACEMQKAPESLRTGSLYR